MCESCYACSGGYCFPNVQAALQKRFDSLEHPDWVSSMSRLINHYSKKSEYFRWFDSGDLQSVAHLQRIVEVCRATPAVKHWMPTREKQILRDYTRQFGELPDNMTSRVSSAMVGGPAPTGFSNTSTVHKEGDKVHGWECPAYKQGGECRDCRYCWDSSVINISYRRH